LIQINESQLKIIFWIKHIGWIILSGIFLVFGVHILIAAYRLNDPFSFILTFFASNFMILFSAALVFVFAYRIKVFCADARLKKPPVKNLPKK